MAVRDDSHGLWWQDKIKVRGKGKRGPRERGPMPNVPDTGWNTPTDFPNLSNAKVIGVDTETYDPELLTAGPGWARGRGHLIGISLAVQDGTSWYFPIRHGIEDGKQILPPEHAQMNMEPEAVLRWANHVLQGPVPKVGANILYDLGWLEWEGVTVGGQLYDIQYAEALLNSETPDVSLEGLARKYLGLGKTSEDLYEWLSLWCGGKPTDKQRKNLFLTPPCLAGPYAESDASLPIQVLTKQWPEMDKRGVLDLFHIECKLIRLLVAMRQRGAPVNVDKATEEYELLGNDMATVEQRMKDLVGQSVNPNAAESIKSAFYAAGIPIPTTIDKKTGNEKVSFAANILEEIEHPLAGMILEHRQISKVRNTFIKSYIIDKNVNGRLHCSFHPLRGDGHGARSGRFASSDPNLQNIPVRTAIGKRVRQCFEAATGGRWVKVDYSQIEYRLLAHHAVGQGADELRAAYAADPLIDYHDKVADLIFERTGIRLPRRNVKNINFGLIYGMAQPKLVASLGISAKEGSELFENYHTAAPFARATMDDCNKEVQTYGYVTTILGRKSDFPMWEPAKRKRGAARETALPYNAACQKWGPLNIVRAFGHKALNRKLQGGAADVMKKAMVSCYEAGLFADDACGMPSLTVHDELDFEDLNDPTRPVWDELKHTMETSLPCRVPIILDMGSGRTWGDAD